MTGFTGKADLLRRIAASRSGAEGADLPTPGAPAPAVAAFAAAHGMHTGFLLLVMAVAPAADWAEMFADLPEGADTGRIARRWMDWLWHDPATGLRAEAGAGAGLAAGDAAMAMQRRAAAGEAISRSEWRQARTAIARLPAVEPVEAAVLGVAAAACWDLDTVPGAAADMILAWRTAMFAMVDRDLGWTAEMDAGLAAREEAIRAAAEARIAADAAEAPAGESEDAAGLRMRASFTAGAGAYVAAHPSDLDRRTELRQAGYRTLSTMAREGLLSAIRGDRPATAAIAA